MPSKIVLIVGTGQLGSRYLQGLSKCRISLQIYVQDIFSESLILAEQRWQEAGGPSTHHEVSFHAEIKQYPQQLDLAIIATAAHNRPEVVKELAQRSRIRYWLIEKVLAQNRQGLAEIQFHVGDALAWVNTPRRLVPWHQRIKAQLQLNSLLHLTVAGGPWGLACNAVHFLDLMAWWSGEALVAVCSDQLEDRWTKAKRAGYWEIYGTLTATFSGGSTAKLISGASGDPTYLIQLTDGNGTWRIDEGKGTAVYTDGTEIPGRLTFQSEMTAALVDEILNTGDCKLPTLNASIAIHRVFIDAMLEHWQRHSDSAATFIPIT
jgi:hypothetical protein